MSQDGTVWEMTYAAVLPAGTRHVLVPGGLGGPDGQSEVAILEGGPVREVLEASTGQVVQVLSPEADEVRVTYRLTPGTRPYPEPIFAHRDTRFTRLGADLVAEVASVAPDLTGIDRAVAIACHTAERFTYGHPERRLLDDLDAVPALGCGLTEGSCVDINTYFIAALRSAGLEAGYVTGFFFPAEKVGACTDGHCWVVTRIDGVLQHWDIAHHLKMGSRRIAPVLNPKPGRRMACFHSMGLSFPDLGIADLKALIEPMAVTGAGPVHFVDPVIRCSNMEPAS